MDDDSVTLALATAVIDEVLTCSEDDIVFALQKLAFDEHLLVEGAAALALSGVHSSCRKGGSIKIILCCCVEPILTMTK